MRLPFAVLLALMTSLGFCSSAYADVDCGDFASHQEAQLYFDRQIGDPDRLDADHDGIACELGSGAAGGYLDRSWEKEQADSFATRDAQYADNAYSDYLMQDTGTEGSEAMAPKETHQEAGPLNISGTTWKWGGIGLLSFIVASAIWEKISNWWNLRRT